MDPIPSSRKDTMTKPPPSESANSLPTPHSQFPSHQSFPYSAPSSFPQHSFPPHSSALPQPYQTSHSFLPHSQPQTSSAVQRNASAPTSALQSPYQNKNQSHTVPSHTPSQLRTPQQFNHLQSVKQPQHPPFSEGFRPTAPHSSSLPLPTSGANLPAYSSTPIPPITRSTHFPLPRVPPIHTQPQLPKTQNSQDHDASRQSHQLPQHSAYPNQHFFQSPRQGQLKNEHGQQQAAQPHQKLNDLKPPPRSSAYGFERPSMKSEPFPNSKSLPFPISHHPQPLSPTGQSRSTSRAINQEPASAPFPAMPQPSALPASTVGSAVPIAHSQPSNHVLLYDIAKLHQAQCSIIGGKVYNDKGHSICGVLNQHDKPCKRIGKCPFHGVSQPVSAQNSCNGFVDESGTATSPNNGGDDSQQGNGGHAVPDGSPAGASTSSNLNSTPNAIPKKQQYKHGWSKEEHYLFLRGLQMHDRGSWKQISNVVQSRNATQVQSHAQKYFLRQKQNNKNKRSIHDLTMDSPEMQELEKRFRSGDFRNVVPSMGLSENLYEPSSNANGALSGVREEHGSGIGQSIVGNSQGIPAFGQSDAVGHNMMNETTLPRYGHTGTGGVARIGHGQAVSATTLGSSMSSGVQIPQLQNAHQSRGNYQSNGFLQPQDILGHAVPSAIASQKKLKAVTPMRPRSDVPQARDVHLSSARPAFPQDLYQSHLGPMQSSMSAILPGAQHGLSPKPGHKILDPVLLPQGTDVNRNADGHIDHGSTQQIYSQNGFPGLYGQSTGNTLFSQGSNRLGGDSQLAWNYDSDTKNRRSRDMMGTGKDAIALQNSFPGIIPDGFGPVGAVGGMSNEHQVDTSFDGATNQHSHSFPTALFGAGETVDMGDHSHAYGVNGQPNAGSSNMGVRDLNVSMNGFGAPNGLQLGGLAVRGQAGMPNTFVRN